MSTTVSIGVAELEQDLINKVTTALDGDKVKVRASYAFDEIDQIDESQLELPLAVVAYEGSSAVSPDAARGQSTAPAHASAIPVNVTFTIVIAAAIDYTAPRSATAKAQELLDKVRMGVYGSRGASMRPWQFMGERPEPDLLGDGKIAVYSQVWQTRVFLQSNV